MKERILLELLAMHIYILLYHQVNAAPATRLPVLAAAYQLERGIHSFQPLQTL
jgi:hypothetical protein